MSAMHYLTLQIYLTYLMSNNDDALNLAHPKGLVIKSIPSDFNALVRHPRLNMR